MEQLHLNIENRLTSVVIGRNLVSNLNSFKERKLILLVDAYVLRLYSDLFISYNCISIPSGEKYKTLSFVESVHRELVKSEIDRSSLIVGVGGGLVTDIAGFIAATYMRGIDVGFISSTLLGQVDASIGGKNGVNLDGYKNMIGTFTQPLFVWCDLALLDTLDKKELLSGLSEVVKYGAIRDKDLFNYIDKYSEKISSLDSASMEHIVNVSAKIKIDIVESDVREKGDRKVLNFGHTFGHAIEKQTGILHGEAVSIGMVMAANISVKLGYLSENEAVKLKKILIKLGLPVNTEVSAEDIFETLLKDKKRQGEKIHFVLLRELGEAVVHEIELNKLNKLLHDLY